MAHEGALTLKEVSNVHAEGYLVGAMTHGPVSVTEPAVESRPSARADATVDDRLIGLGAGESMEFEQYLVLRRALERAHAATGLTRIAVTSPTSDEGKTTTAINIAAALARNRHAKVLLIDADLRLPTIATRLRLANGRPGLAELLTNPDIGFADTVRPLPASNLSVLPAGTLGTGNPYELFHSPRFSALLEYARGAYDFVIIDTPPVIPVADCRVLEASVDGFLVVVSAHRTPRRLLAETLTVLGPDKTLGLVLNRIDQPFEGAYADYRYYSRTARTAR